ncbi:OmpA family protein [Telluria beijingensis]|uniref:OmpA family protein n=1 Tax=Telluria beijingensis TaxID=3068633 RepID=UPI0027953476|nr:OmpA family protein [Massilia sp. REN29]
MNNRLFAAACLLAALPAFAQDAVQEAPVIEQGKEDMGTLVDALEPKKPVRTRSIRIVRDDVGSPAVAPEPPKVSLLITFETNSATLTARSRESLQVVGQALASEKLAPFRFAIEGHADPRGNPAANLALSQARARSVRAYLVDTMKIDAARLDAVGKGDRELMNKANPDAPENRRVTIVNLSR